jgi:hypothetical protein
VLVLFTAFYILLRRQDAVTTKKQEAKGIKKKFPNPFGSDSAFQNAAWPHAVARHLFVPRAPDDYDWV